MPSASPPGTTTDLSRLPVYEPGLADVVARCRGRNLHFTTEVDGAIADADMVFLSVNTPTKTRGLGAGQASDLRWIEASARTVAAQATGHTIVVEKSTLPVRTAEAIKEILTRVPGGGERRQPRPSRCSPTPSSWRRAPPSPIWRIPIGC